MKVKRTDTSPRPSPQSGEGEGFCRTTIFIWTAVAERSGDTALAAPFDRVKTEAGESRSVNPNPDSSGFALPAQSMKSVRSGTSAFTMVEIAICLAVIAFALVAIIGVLPLGVQVQADNRQESIIQRDGAYFLDAIRKGAPPDDLRLYVEDITMTFSNKAGNGTIIVQTNVSQDLIFQGPDGNGHIIGLLSNPDTVKTEATVKALSGAANEKGIFSNDIAFKYKMTVIVRPLDSLNPYISTNQALYDWYTNLTHEVRLVLRYPLTYNGQTGTGKKIFRAMVSGKMNQDDPGSLEYFFYRHGLTNSIPGVTNNTYAL